MSDDTAADQSREANITFEVAWDSIYAQAYLDFAMDGNENRSQAVWDLSPLRWDVSIAGKLEC